MENNESQLSLLKRFWIYQKERFPLFGHGPLIAAFSFSALGYSRVCQGLDTFVAWPEYLGAFFISFTLFLMLRIFDEFKDNEDDLKYRTYLPVPRGLVSLKELKVLGVFVVCSQIAVLSIWYPTLFPFYIAVFIYLILMGKEFFVAEWLKKKPILYMVSHMFIIPFIDIVASSFDWSLNGVEAPFGLLFFFLVSYFNGMVIEIGRKIKTPENEEPGVTSYSGEWGPKRAVWVWIGILTITLLSALSASYYAHAGILSYIILIGLYVICLIPGFLFMNNMTKKGSKAIEIISGVWTLLMYLILGGGPMLANLF